MWNIILLVTFVSSNVVWADTQLETSFVRHCAFLHQGTPRTAIPLVSSAILPRSQSQAWRVQGRNPSLLEEKAFFQGRERGQAQEGATNTKLWLSESNNEDKVSSPISPEAETNSIDNGDDKQDDDISEAMFEQLEEGNPPLGMILTQLLGINIFTYILAGAIVIMLTLNAVLGPGWLGQGLGIPGTGTYTNVSDSLPSQMNLNSPENLL
jgi:hypothetical protein